MKKYSKEFKVTACELVTKDGLKTKAVAAKLGINPKMLNRWINELADYGNDAFVGRGNLRESDIEVRKLEKEIERLKVENEILKKAAAYFAKHPADE